MVIPKNELKDFLDSKVLQYNTIDFIEPDPISVPHRYFLKEDAAWTAPSRWVP